MAKDPVCGMEVDEKMTKFKTPYMGKVYYFCAAACKAEFERNPGKYVKGAMAHHHGGWCC